MLRDEGTTTCKPGFSQSHFVRSNHQLVELWQQQRHLDEEQVASSYSAQLETMLHYIATSPLDVTLRELRVQQQELERNVAAANARCGAACLYL
jgi:hypothetical protein